MQCEISRKRNLFYSLANKRLTVCYTYISVFIRIFIRVYKYTRVISKAVPASQTIVEYFLTPRIIALRYNACSRHKFVVKNYAHYSVPFLQKVAIQILLLVSHPLTLPIGDCLFPL